MNDANQPDDLTADWPDEPGKTDVEAFAQALAAGAPQLPPDALARVEERMREELRQLHRRRWRRRLLRAGAAAASIVVALLVFRPFDRPASPPAAEPPATPVEVVRDTYRVPLLVTPAPPAPEKPLIALDSYQGLFSN